MITYTVETDKLLNPLRKKKTSEFHAWRTPYLLNSLKTTPVPQSRFHAPCYHPDRPSPVSPRREQSGHTAFPDKGLDWGRQCQQGCESPTASVWNWSSKCCDHGVVLIYLVTRPYIREGTSQTFVFVWDDIYLDFEQNMELIGIQTPPQVSEKKFRNVGHHQSHNESITLSSSPPLADNPSFVDFEGAEEGGFAYSGSLSQLRHSLLEPGQGIARGKNPEQE